MTRTDRPTSLAREQRSAGPTIHVPLQMLAGRLGQEDALDLAALGLAQDELAPLQVQILDGEGLRPCSAISLSSTRKSPSCQGKSTSEAR